MTQHLLLSAALAVVAGASSGCTLFRKSQKPRESTAISSEVEATFRQRWMDKRLAELKAQGVADAAAQTQAAQEFEARYQFDRKPQR
ncbi:MAG: hypothetical protein FJ381_06320 [Verrucomicrobia bacterium]|nr:hypothetical protein [Verrucomicrobiota bacterium]